MRYRDLFPGPRSTSLGVSDSSEVESNQAEGPAAREGTVVDAERLARWLRGLPDGRDSEPG
jgi:hypothetical protein